MMSIRGILWPVRYFRFVGVGHKLRPASRQLAEPRKIARAINDDSVWIGDSEAETSSGR